MRDRNRVVVDCSNDKILTKQSFKKETDINQIMARFIKTGIITEDALAKRQASFADVSNIGDYQECQNQIHAAQAAFMTLAPQVRARFQNNPAELLDFVSHKENREEAIQLGIIPTPKETPPETTPKPVARGKKQAPKGPPLQVPPLSAEGGPSGPDNEQVD